MDTGLRFSNRLARWWPECSRLKRGRLQTFLIAPLDARCRKFWLPPRRFSGRTPSTRETHLWWCYLSTQKRGETYIGYGNTRLLETDKDVAHPHIDYPWGQFQKIWHLYAHLPDPSILQLEWQRGVIKDLRVELKPIKLEGTLQQAEVELSHVKVVQVISYVGPH